MKMYCEIHGEEFDPDESNDDACPSCRDSWNPLPEIDE